MKFRFDLLAFGWLLQLPFAPLTGAQSLPAGTTPGAPTSSTCPDATRLRAAFAHPDAEVAHLIAVTGVRSSPHGGIDVSPSRYWSRSPYSPCDEAIFQMTVNGPDGYIERDEFFAVSIDARGRLVSDRAPLSDRDPRRLSDSTLPDLDGDGWPEHFVIRSSESICRNDEYSGESSYCVQCEIEGAAFGFLESSRGVPLTQTRHLSGPAHSERINAARQAVALQQRRADGGLNMACPTIGQWSALADGTPFMVDRVDQRAFIRRNVNRLTCSGWHSDPTTSDARCTEASPIQEVVEVFAPPSVPEGRRPYASPECRLAARRGRIEMRCGATSSPCTAATVAGGEDTAERRPIQVLVCGDAADVHIGLAQTNGGAAPTLLGVAPLGDRAVPRAGLRVLAARIEVSAELQFLPLVRGPFSNTPVDPGSDGSPRVVVTWLNAAQARHETVLDVREGFTANLGTLETCSGSDAANLRSPACDVLQTFSFYGTRTTRWDLSPRAGDSPTETPYRFRMAVADPRTGILGRAAECVLPMPGIEGIHTMAYYGWSNVDEPPFGFSTIVRTHRAYVDALRRSGVVVPDFEMTYDVLRGPHTDYGLWFLPDAGECPASVLRWDGSDQSTVRWVAAYASDGSISVRSVAANSERLVVGTHSD